MKMAARVDHELAAGLSPVPLTVLTGFLGAGKTTLLNRILNGDHGLKVAVLVNDFGAINIDAELVVGVEGNVVSLANGCICCTIRGDLIEAVMATINRPEKPEYLLLEASGVAEPSGIAMTFNNPSFRDRLRLDGILCVVDAAEVFAAPETAELKIFQMACADLIILNKVDLVGPRQIAHILRWLDERFHRYRLIETSRGQVPLEILLSAGRFDAAPGQHERDCPRRAIGGGDFEHRDHGHSRIFDTWSYETERPLRLEALRETISRLPAQIYRAKGVIYASDMPERRAVLQAVGRRVDISFADKWGERLPRTRIVAIGAAGAVDGPALQAALEPCIAAAPGGRQP